MVLMLELNCGDTPKNTKRKACMCNTGEGRVHPRASHRDIFLCSIAIWQSGAGGGRVMIKIGGKKTAGSG